MLNSEPKAFGNRNIMKFAAATAAFFLSARLMMDRGEEPF